MRKLKLAVGSEEDPGAEQDARAASWRGADDGFVGDVLQDGIQLDMSEEAELQVECAAGQVLSVRLVRGLVSGAGHGRRASPLPAACPAWLPEVTTLCGGVSQGLQRGF